MAATQYFLNQVMGNTFRTKTIPALPTSYYFGLSTTTPTISGANVNEPSKTGTGYSRILLTGLSEPSNGVITNPNVIGFNESILSWGAITNYVVYDSATGGNLLFYAPFTSTIHIDPGTLFLVKAGELKLTLRNP